MSLDTMGYKQRELGALHYTLPGEKTTILSMVLNDDAEKEGNCYKWEYK